MSTKELYKSNDTRHTMNINAMQDTMSMVQYIVSQYTRNDIDIES